MLNSELPATIRCHSITQFNQGIYDIIVASDEKALEQEQADVKTDKKSKRKKDKESGVSRGIDFQCVANVINFDFPQDVQSYIHRAGRTARGNNQVKRMFALFLVLYFVINVLREMYIFVSYFRHCTYRQKI